MMEIETPFATTEVIQNVDNIYTTKTEHICNICTDNIDIDDLIILKCNDLHVFCYDCIYSWFKLCEKNIGSYYEYKHRMCPICKKDGGLLPNKYNEDPKPNIHDIPLCKFEGCHQKMTIKEIKTKNDLGLCLKHYCLEKLICQHKTKYSNIICGLHATNSDIGTYCTTHKIKMEALQSKMCNTVLHYGNKCQCMGYAKYNGKCYKHKNIGKITICNTPLLTKNGICSYKGLEKYGGKCYYHKNITTNTNTDIVNGNTDIVNENINETQVIDDLCNALLVSKSGNCKKKGSTKYGGKCHIHKIVS